MSIRPVTTTIFLIISGFALLLLYPFRLPSLLQRQQQQQQQQQVSKSTIMASVLTSVVVGAKAKHTATVFWLHGLGDSGAG